MSALLNFLFYFIGRSVCHQLTERSLTAGGMYLPLCARCTGIYLGIFISYTYLFIKKRLICNKSISLFVVFVIAASLLPIAFDGLTSYLNLRESSNLIRIITGILAGYGLPVLFALANGEPLDSKRGLAEILIIAAILSFTVYNGFLNIYIISAVLCSGVYLLFYHVIKMLILALTKNMNLKKASRASIIAAAALILVFSLANAKLRDVFINRETTPPIINRVY